MGYRIGLDIGITSVGWSAIEDDANGNPIRIIDLGSRIFDVAEKPKRWICSCKSKKRCQRFTQKIKKKKT